MKAKKLISVFLAAVMLVVPMALVSFAADTYSVNVEQLKSVYTDSESYNPQGLILAKGAERIEYSPLDENFRFDPALTEKLTVTVNDKGVVVPTEVRVFYNNQYAGSVTVTVSHTPGSLVSFGDKGHGHYCEGCGAVLDMEPHQVPEWIPNDDKGFFIQQTESGYCEVCGQKVTRIHGEYTKDPGTGEDVLTPGTDHFRFKEIFDYDTLTDTEKKIVDFFQMIVVTLVQAMVGIK